MFRIISERPFYVQPRGVYCGGGGGGCSLWLSGAAGVPRGCGR